MKAVKEDIRGYLYAMGTEELILNNVDNTENNTKDAFSALLFLLLDIVETLR